MIGFIKLHRKLQKWEWYSDSQTVHLFIHLLLEANYEPNKWQGIEIKRGQLIFGRKVVAETLGISEQSIRTCITRLKSTNEITIKSTNRYSLITIVKYEDYQGYETESTSTSTSKLTFNQPATNQQSTTLKEYKEVNNTKLTNMSGRAEKYVQYVNQIFNRKYRATDKVVKKFKARIEVDKYSTDELQATIKNVHADKYHKDHGYKWATPEFLLREDIIEKYKVKSIALPVQSDSPYGDDTTPIAHDDDSFRDAWYNTK